MKPCKTEVETFIYEGNNNMINFKDDKILDCPKEFKAQLKLKTGKIVEAPHEWRKLIWGWWHEARKEEIQEDILLQACDDIKQHCGRATKRAYKLRV
jgi:hypothetical protein